MKSYRSFCLSKSDQTDEYNLYTFTMVTHTVNENKKHCSNKKYCSFKWLILDSDILNRTNLQKHLRMLFYFINLNSPSPNYTQGQLHLDF